MMNQLDDIYRCKAEDRSKMNKTLHDSSAERSLIIVIIIIIIYSISELRE